MKFLAILLLLIIVAVVVLVIRSRSKRKARVVKPQAKNEWQVTHETYGGTTYQSAVSKPTQSRATLPSSSNYARPTSKPAPKARKTDRDDDEVVYGGYMAEADSFYAEPSVDVNEPTKVDTTPAYEAPAPTYEAPKPAYEAPTYTPPASNYEAPASPPASASDTSSNNSPDTSSY